MFTSSNYGIVPNQYQANAEFTAAVVNDVFANFPANYFRFTSGYRTSAQNENANGVSNSFHLTAEAADFVPNNGSFPYAELERIGEVVKQYGYEVIHHNAGSGEHYHIEPSPTGKHPISGSQISAGTNQNLELLKYGVVGFLLYKIFFD